MLIRYAQLNDKTEWFRLDRHLPEAGFEEKIRNKQGYVLTEDDKVIGVLRFNFFWDNTPFCTMLFIDSDHRRKGYGKLLMEHWEQDMRSKGYGMRNMIFRKRRKSLGRTVKKHCVFWRKTGRDRHELFC